MIKKWMTFHSSRRRFVKKILQKFQLLAKCNSGQSGAQAYRAKANITQGSYLKHHEHWLQ